MWLKVLRTGKDPYNRHLHKVIKTTEEDDKTVTVEYLNHENVLSTLTCPKEKGWGVYVDGDFCTLLNEHPAFTEYKKAEAGMVVATLDMLYMYFCRDAHYDGTFEEWVEHEARAFIEDLSEELMDDVTRCSNSFTRRAEIHGV